MISRRRSITSTCISCRLRPESNPAIATVTAKELSAQLQANATYSEALRKGSESASLSSASGKSKGAANILLRKVDAAVGKSFGTNQERKVYLRKAWNMAARHQGAVLFITVTPNENGSATVSFYAGEIQHRELFAITMEDVPNR